LGGSSDWVVIAIIALLTALLSPALQSASQAAHCEQDANNLESKAPAIANDESSQGFDPIGIWNQGLAPARDGNRSMWSRSEDASEVAKKRGSPGMTSQQVSRRSALKVASGASFLAAWFAAGCSKTEEAKDETGKAQSLEDSITKQRGRGKKGAPAAPAPTQRVKSGRE
jgi:hypothetical protein